MATLTASEKAELRYLAQSRTPLWGGVLERGGDMDTLRWQQAGLIGVVKRPVTVGNATFRGGYMITAKGLEAIGLSS